MSPSSYDPSTCADGPNSWHVHSWEDYFEKVTDEQLEQSMIHNNGIACRPSQIIPDGKGVFSTTSFTKGQAIEWGVATIIPRLTIHESDAFFAWTSFSKTGPAATLSGHCLFYNTLGDDSNVRCVPYHEDKRFEIYALRDIEEGEELTIRYDSMNWRDAMTEVKGIVGELQGDHNQK
eukprot:CAMPEP_0119010788 /NCGR_PEP_ID=MMETSP1176-20130426/5249_1 /TAXON_ID=265551 /ORGANISM="Synedropsis recta cf, Strain CCMP1620" /LENGTH=176 /DNA_ID=CAMNT_0006963519 /DNA_START=91 /DNA_END=621 /DNA_ORIENTATION=+